MEQLMTVAQVAEYLNVSRNTVYNMLKAGRLSGSKPSGDWRFDPAVVASLKAAR